MEKKSVCTISKYVITLKLVVPLTVLICHMQTVAFSDHGYAAGFSKTLCRYGTSCSQNMIIIIPLTDQYTELCSLISERQNMNFITDREFCLIKNAQHRLQSARVLPKVVLSEDE